MPIGVGMSVAAGGNRAVRPPGRCRPPIFQAAGRSPLRTPREDVAPGPRSWRRRTPSPPQPTKPTPGRSLAPRGAGGRAKDRPASLDHAGSSAAPAVAFKNSRRRKLEKAGWVSLMGALPPLGRLHFLLNATQHVVHWPGVELVAY